MTSYAVQGRLVGSGPDVAMYQPGTRFDQVRLTEDAGWIKATEGIGYLDPWFTRHAAAANTAGFRWGPYHFCRPGNDPVREALWFAQVILATPGWSLPPVLDMEQPGTGAWVLKVAEVVETQTGVRPMIYTGAYVAYDRPAGLVNYRLWIAAYNAGYNVDPNPEAIGQPPSCAPWGHTWTAWQYTSSANVAGVPGRCDRSVIDADWLASLTAKPSPTIPPSEDDDMPYTPAQLEAIGIDAITKASVFLARDPTDGGIYVFCRLSMDRRHLPSEDAVKKAREQLGIPWLRGDGAPNQDVDPEVVHLFAINEDDAAATVKLTSAQTATISS